MNNIFVATRKELTEKLNEALTNGFECFRIKHDCNCKPVLKHPDQNIKANQRNGIIILKGDKVKQIFVRCKKCYHEQNGKK